MRRLLPGSRLVLATHNQGKLEELTALLAPLELDLRSAKDLRLPVPVETENTYVGNARLKAHAASKASGLPALADDSGFEIDALEGAPGVFTADWAETPGGRDFGQAMVRAWAALEAKAAPHPRLGRFRCTLVLAWPDGEESVFSGALEGQCVWPPRGQAIGFDPMFQPLGSTLTLAEMDRWQSNETNHRGQAFAQLRMTMI